MRILCWNVRGLNGTSDVASSQMSVVELANSNKVPLICLFETKLSSSLFLSFLENRFPTWGSINNFDEIENGRMEILWDISLVECEIVEVGRQHINLKVECKVTQQCFLITVVYPIYTVGPRRVLWDHLSVYGSSVGLPWIVPGDFNCYPSTKDKRGGNKLTAYEVKDLGEFMAGLGLVDAPSSGQFFTYTNGKVWSKLDRVLINNVWEDRGLSCLAHYLPMEPTSDHTPMVVSILDNKREGSWPFKFHNMWIQHHRCQDTVRETWRMHVSGTTQFKLCSKLKALKQPLKSLNRAKLGGISDKARMAKVEFKGALE